MALPSNKWHFACRNSAHLDAELKHLLELEALDGALKPSRPSRELVMVTFSLLLHSLFESASALILFLVTASLGEAGRL